MRTGLTLFFLISFSLVFTLWESKPTPKCDNPVHAMGEPKHDMYMFSDHRITLENYTYYIFEHLFIITILFLYWLEALEYSKEYVKVFLILQVIDLIEYLLTYNGEYFKISTYPVSYNTIMIATYGVFLIIEQIKIEKQKIEWTR